MSSSSGKRKSVAKKIEVDLVANATNALIDNCHDYSSFYVEWRGLSVTPKKPPLKKGKTEMANTNTDIVATLPEFINARSDELKTLVQNNSVQITSLRGEMEVVCRQMS